MQQWKEEPSPQLIFFFDSMKYQKLFGFTSVPNDKRVPLMSSYPELLLSSIHSGSLLDSSVPLCDYSEAVQDLLHIFYSSRKQLTLSQISQRRKYRESKIRKDEKEGSLDSVVDEDINCLALTDRSLGPLILPGPSLGTNTSSLEPTLGDQDPPLYLERGSSITQHQIWPDLDPIKFALIEGQTASQRGLQRLLCIASNIHTQVKTLPLFSIRIVHHLLLDPSLQVPPHYSFTTRVFYLIA
jgi:hypothetical protein